MGSSEHGNELFDSITGKEYLY